MAKKVVLTIFSIVLILTLFPIKPVQASHRPVLIFVPGIMGSELWINRPDDLAWFDVIDDKYLNYDNRERYPLEVGEPLGWRGSDARKYDRLNFYGAVQDYFEDNYRLYAFPYDWRRPNEENARLLEDEIERIKQEEGVEKVNILAHSMGGLVSKKYILNTQGKSVDKFITLGTPYFGAPVAFDRLMSGFVEHTITLKGAGVVQSIPAVYQLLPNKMYFNLNNTAYMGELDSTVKPSTRTAYSYVRTKEELKKYYRNGLIDAAEEFHNDMTDSVGKYVDFYRIIGDAEPTAGFIFRETYRYRSGEMKRWTTAEVSGDGTVPISGAARGSERTWFISEEHTNLTKNEAVLDAVNEILHNRRVQLRTTPKEPDGLKIQIYDASDNNFVSEGPKLIQTLASTEPISILSYSFQPNIELEYSDGTRFVMKDGIVESDPKGVQVRNFDSTIELVVPQGDYKVHVSRSGSESQAGVLLSRIDNGVNTSRLDYQELDLSSGSIVSEIHRDFSTNKVGMDNDGDNAIDQIADPIEMEPINETVNAGTYDNETPPSNPGDPQDPSEPGAGDGSIQIGISGTLGENKWYTSPVTISASTTITFSPPVPDGEDSTSVEEQNAILSIQVDDEGEQTGDSLTYTSDGKHTAKVFAKDAEGHVLGQATRAFKIDQIQPGLDIQTAGEPGDNGWLISDSEVSVGASDETSKLAQVNLAITKPDLHTYEGPVTVTDEGIRSIYAKAVDNAGLITNEEKTLKIDKTKPIIANVHLQDEYYWGEEFPIQFEVNDAISGVASVSATVYGEPVANGTTYKFTRPGWHTYRIEVKDHAGWKAVFETKFEVYIPARVNFDPDSLQLDHGSGMATSYIELPQPFAPENINFSTVQTNTSVVHVQDDKYGYVINPIDDSDENGIPEMKLKYERESLVNVIPPGDDAISHQNPNPPAWGSATITIFGEWGPYHIKGYDYIKVSNKGYVPPPPDVTPPAIHMEPEDGSKDVSVDVTPVVAFSEKVFAGDGELLSDVKAARLLSFKTLSGEAVPFTANWMKNTHSIQINPSHRLDGNQTYTVEVSAGSVTDTVYNPTAYFKSAFTTMPYSFSMQAPLPLPLIEEEKSTESPAIQSVQQSVPQTDVDRSSETATSNLFQQESVQFGEDVTVVDDAELKESLEKFATSETITISSTLPNMAFSLKQWDIMKASGKPLKIGLKNAVFLLVPGDLSIADPNAGYVLFGAEAVNDDYGKKVMDQASNRKGAVFVSKNTLHLRAVSRSKDKEQPFETINGTVKVSVIVPKSAQIAGFTQVLQMARYNELTQALEFIPGTYKKTDQTFEFETTRFSYWGFAIKTRSLSDIVSHWAKPEIETMTSLGIINGFETGAFKPDSEVTRSQFVTMISKVLELEGEEDIPFVDVEPGEWYEQPIRLVYREGIISGINSNHFAPNEFMTREQAAVILSRVLGKKKLHSAVVDTHMLQNRFSDHGLISEWAAASVAELTSLSIVTGKAGDKEVEFGPQDTLTRAEAAVLIKRLNDYINM